jgi:hypothetical protein
MVGESGTDLGLRGFVGLKRYRYYYLTTCFALRNFGRRRSTFPLSRFWLIYESPTIRPLVPVNTTALLWSNSPL